MDTLSVPIENMRWKVMLGRSLRRAGSGKGIGVDTRFIGDFVKWFRI